MYIRKRVRQEGLEAERGFAEESGDVRMSSEIPA